MNFLAEDHYWAVFTISILLIGLWTFLMVDACDRIGCILNVSDLVTDGRKLIRYQGGELGWIAGRWRGWWR